MPPTKQVHVQMPEQTEASEQLWSSPKATSGTKPVQAPEPILGPALTHMQATAKGTP